MKLREIFISGLAATTVVFASSCAHQRARQISQPAKSAAVTKTVAPVVTTPPVYVPDTSHENDPLPDGILAWNSLMQSTNVAADADKAYFLIAFTNVSSGLVSILNVHPSCGCTTAQLPNLPWTIPAGGSGKIPVTVNVEGKTGILFKSIHIATDKGAKDLYLRITMLPAPPMKLTDAQRAQQMAIAKIDRQAVFHNDCATCHVKRGEGKYGKALYDADCAICHEGPTRATMVPDLHTLKTPTNFAFWQTWIAHGKPGSLMPAFSTSDGGPLNDMQIASLASYLNSAMPSRVPPPAQ